MTRALITNDDGITSEGLTRLARVACDIGLDVVVAAPLDDASGSSAALTAIRADGRVVVERRRLNGLPDVDAFAVGAVPAFITLLATRRAFGPAPDFVLSGINRGANTGHAVLHSGTVGAALTGATHGCRAQLAVLAISGRLRRGADCANSMGAMDCALGRLDVFECGFFLEAVPRSTP